MRIYIRRQRNQRSKRSFDKVINITITHMSGEPLRGFENIVFPVTPVRLLVEYFFLAEAALQITPEGEIVLFLMEYSYGNLIRYGGFSAKLEPFFYGQEDKHGLGFQLTNFYWDNTPKDGEA